MENYYSKIKTLEKNLVESQKVYNKLYRRRETLNDQKKTFLWTQQIEQELTLIQDTMKVVLTNINSISDQLQYLQEEYDNYIAKNSREFYKPMDNVDIIMLIHKDGSIHGTIL